MWRNASPRLLQGGGGVGRKGEGGVLPRGCSLLSWASNRGCIPVTRMPGGIMEIPVCFYPPYPLTPQRASANIKCMLSFKETNQNPPRKTQNPGICCALKNMQWVYDLLRHTGDSFLLTDGNLRLFCFLLLFVTRPDCVKLLAPKPGCE